MSNPWACSVAFPCGYPDAYIGTPVDGSDVPPVFWTDLQAKSIEWTWKTLQISLSGTATMSSPPGGAGVVNTISWGPISGEGTADSYATKWSDLIEAGRYPMKRAWNFGAVGGPYSVVIPPDYGGGTGSLFLSATVQFFNLYYLPTTPRKFVKGLAIAVQGSVELPSPFQTSIARLSTFVVGPFVKAGTWKALDQDIAYMDSSAGSVPLSITCTDLKVVDSGARIPKPGPIG